MVSATAYFATCLLLCAAGMAAQPGRSDAQRTSAPNPQPVLRLEVRRVPVEVVVTDSHGNPVHGLKRNEFFLSEDGKPQRIRTFEEIDNAIEPVPSIQPHLSNGSFTNIPALPERPALYVLYYDMVNTRRAVQMQFYRQLLEFIDQAEPGTRVAIFANTTGLHLIQGFTTDHDRLKRAVLNRGPGPHVPSVFLGGADTFGPGEYGTGETGPTLRNLDAIARYLSGVPGRKNLIWLADNFPIHVGPYFEGVDPTLLDNDAIRETYAELMRSEFAVYPVNIFGVRAGAGAVVAGQDEDGIAESTGGRAYHGDNAIAALMRAAVRHGSSYYALTYQPANSKMDGGLRHIELRIKRSGGYTVAYRRFYFATPDVIAPDSSQNDNWYQATLRHGAPPAFQLAFIARLSARGAPRQAGPEQIGECADARADFRAESFGGAATRKVPVSIQTYAIHYRVLDPQLKSAARRRALNPVLDFSAAAYDSEGGLLNGVRNTGVASTEAADRNNHGLFEAEQEMDVPSCAASVRMAIRDRVTGRIGALELDLPIQRSSQQ